MPNGDINHLRRTQDIIKDRKLIQLSIKDKGQREVLLFTKNFINVIKDTKECYEMVQIRALDGIKSNNVEKCDTMKEILV